MEWYNCSFLVLNASLDIANKRSITEERSGILGHHVMDLLGSSCAAHPITCEIIHGLLELGRIVTYLDSYTSPLTGPNTVRINFVFPEHNIIPMTKPILESKISIVAIGKKALIEEYNVVSNFCLDLVITKVNPNDINELLACHPTWFCGALPERSDEEVKGAKKP